MTFNLFKDTSDFLGGTDCDGCGRTIPPNEVFLSGIESCCGGGCHRSLCRECVLAAALLFEPDGWSRETDLMDENHVDPEC